MIARPSTIKLAIEAVERNNKQLAKAATVITGLPLGAHSLRRQNREIKEKLQEMLKNDKRN